MKRCTASAMGAHSVPSSKPGKMYSVVIADSGEHTCNCPAMAIQNNKLSSKGLPRNYLCKHINAVLSGGGGCPWTSDHPTKQEYPHICPLCQSNTEEVDLVTEDPDEEQMNDALAGLLAIRDRLQ